VEKAISGLSRLTKVTTDVTLPETSGYLSVLLTEMYAYHKDLFEEQEDRYMMATRALLRGLEEKLSSKETACGDNIVGYIRRRWQLELLRRKIDSAFSDFDLVVLPTLRTGPKKLKYVIDYHEHPKDRNPDDMAFDNCEAFNVLGLPAISIPCGLNRSGLPVGLMIAGPSFSDGRVLALARAFERQYEWEKRRPPLAPDTLVPAIRIPDQD
jgi:aspartyl-tRNA(Asn)/glutamyl-tRNA(Gln) amidotransferase subunit A